MKDCINGISYNTKTAETIAHNGSGKTINHSDERWFSETLYRKKSGEFFYMVTVAFSRSMLNRPDRIPGSAARLSCR